MMHHRFAHLFAHPSHGTSPSAPASLHLPQSLPEEEPTMPWDVDAAALLDDVLDAAGSRDDDAPPHVALPELVESRLEFPEHFVPEYAYPLIVWLDDSCLSIGQTLPEISDRNYLGLGVTAPLPDVGRCLDLAALENVVESLTSQVRVHSARVYIGGHGDYGTLALQSLLQAPELFAGAICLNADFPNMPAPLRRFRDLHGKRVLFSSATEARKQPLGAAIDATRLLYNAGMPVATRIYKGSPDSVRSRMMRDVDRWIMDGIATAVK